jgi:hypothetical protein
MDREEGFPPHMVGFMKRKREKEKPGEKKLPKAGPMGDEPGRTNA